MTNEVSTLPKPFFISIIPNFAGEEEYLADVIRKRFRNTGITDYAMSYPLHPQGDDVYEKTSIQKASFRKLKALLKDVAYRNRMLQEYDRMIQILGPAGASHQAASKMIELLSVREGK